MQTAENKYGPDEDLKWSIIKALDPGLGRTIDDYGRDYVERTWPHVLEDTMRRVERLIPLFKEFADRNEALDDGQQ